MRTKKMEYDGRVDEDSSIHLKFHVLFMVFDILPGYPSQTGDSYSISTACFTQLFKCNFMV